jgi:hypothetical protein
MNRIRLPLFASFLFLVGCVSPWEKFYSGVETPADYAYGGSTLCRRVDNPEEVKAYLREGYLVFGESSFNAGGGVSLDNLQTQGEKVGADIVLFWAGNAQTSQSAMVIPQFNPGTQQTTYVNGYGSGGSFSGTATTYTPGTYSTQVVPVTVTRMDYSAIFLRRRITKPALGVSVREMTATEASALGTNSAVAIELVIRSTPAFEADVLEGDFLLEIDGTKVPDVRSFLEIIASKRGQTIRALISHRGTRLYKMIRTNP